MNDVELAQFEELSNKFYNATSTQETNSVHTALMQFCSTPDFIPKCQYIFGHSENPYALVISSRSLTTLVTDHWNNFSPEQRAGLREYIFQFLAKKGPYLPGYVLPNVIELLCRITRLGWLLENGNQDILDEIKKFLPVSVEHKILGLKVYSTLVTELDTPQYRNSNQDDRKIAYYFRELHLYGIFQSCIEILEGIRMSNYDFQDDEQKVKLTEAALTLFRNCLAFDFIGTNPDESAVETGPVYIPISWKETITNPNTLQILVDLYYSNEPPITSCVLECLIYVTSIRRTVFSDTDTRADYLALIIKTLTNILSTQKGLDDLDTYHIFCRLLGRLKANYQLTDIISLPGYSHFIELVADFTVRSFASWEWCANSTIYLVMFWSRLVTAIPTLPESQSDPQLSGFVVKIVEAYAKGRLESVKPMNLEDSDLLNEIESLSSELKYLPGLFRFQLMESGKFFTSTFDQLASKLAEGLSMLQTTDGFLDQLHVIEGQLSWIVHFIAVIFGSTTPRPIFLAAYDTQSGNEQVDGDLAKRVFQLLSTLAITQQVPDGRRLCDQRLEIAILEFFIRFKQNYITDQYCYPPSASLFSMDAAGNHFQAYRLLYEQMGLGEYKDVLKIIITKIAANLKMWPDNDKIIEKTLEVFKELSVGFSFKKQLVDVEEVKFILQNHTVNRSVSSELQGATFPFLNDPRNIYNRTTYYYTLAHLVLLDSLQFEQFLSPFLAALDGFKSMFERHITPEAFQLVGIFRDMRGIVRAITTPQNYIIFFEAIYPRYFSIFNSVVAAFCINKGVISAFLTFLSELLYIDSSAAALIRRQIEQPITDQECSVILSNLTNCLRQSHVPTDSEVFLKSVKLTIDCFNKVFVGDYCTFGVFEVYNDDALSNAFNSIFTLAFSLDQSVLMTLTKIADNYMSFLDVFFRTFLTSLVRLAPKLILDIMKTLRLGLNSIQPSIVNHSCSALNSLGTFYYSNMKRNIQVAVDLRDLIPPNCDLWMDLLFDLFRVVICDKSAKVQYSFARPMLPFMLIYTGSIDVIRQRFKDTQPESIHAKLDSSFANLAAGIEPNLDNSNRELFLAHITTFKQDLSSFVFIHTLY